MIPVKIRTEKSVTKKSPKGGEEGENESGTSSPSEKGGSKREAGRSKKEKSASESSREIHH